MACSGTDWDYLPTTIASYLRQPMRPDAFFNRTIPSSSFTSCEVCPKVAVVPDTPAGGTDTGSLSTEATLMNDSPNCLSDLKGCRQVTLMRSHWLPRACLVKESELEIFTINEKRATQPSLIYIYIYLMFQFHWAFKSLTLFVNILFRLH